MNKFIGILSFSIGAAVGSVVTWKLIKTKYEKQSQEAIEEVRELYSKKLVARDNEVKKAHEYSKVVSGKTDYSSVVSDLGYSSEEIQEEENPLKEPEKKEPYVIPPDEFGELDEFKTESLTYYSDSVLTYDSGEVIRDIDDIVGTESLNCFGEYEDDSVFVRNEALETDFEILLDTRRYVDVMSRNLHPVNDDQ